MERNRKDRNGGVLDTVAELFDLPADLVAGLPHLEMMGSRQLYLEHHTGILAYSDEQIDVNTTGGVLRVRGARLALLAMTMILSVLTMKSIRFRALLCGRPSVVIRRGEIDQREMRRNRLTVDELLEELVRSYVLDLSLIHISEPTRP